MAVDVLSRVLARLQNLPSMSLPTDYPRAVGTNKLIEAAHVADLSEQTSLALLKLAVHTEDVDVEAEEPRNTPSAFHLLLAAFTVLLHRFTGDTNVVVRSSSGSASAPLLLCLAVDPTDTFWSVVCRIQQVKKEAEAEAEADVLPYETIVKALHKDQEDQDHPIFRVRFFDETDRPRENFIRSTSLNL